MAPHFFPGLNLGLSLTCPLPLKVLSPYRGMLLEFEGNNLDFLFVRSLLILKYPFNSVKPIYKLIWLKLSFKFGDVHLYVVMVESLFPWSMALNR